MQKATERAARKLHRSARLLEYRRLNWRVETNHRIVREFEAFVVSAHKAGLPFKLHVSHHHTPNEGTVQIMADPMATGAVDRKIALNEYGMSNVDTPVLETGGEFVASQSVQGYVHFIVYPRRSDRIKPKKESQILFQGFEPTDVTVDVVRRALKRYLILLQSSSVVGGASALTYQERFIVLWIAFRDLRNRYELYLSLLTLRNEWGKAVIAGVVAFLIGYISGTKSP